MTLNKSGSLYYEIPLIKEKQQAHEESDLFLPKKLGNYIDGTPAKNRFIISEHQQQQLAKDNIQ